MLLTILGALVAQSGGTVALQASLSSSASLSADVSVGKPLAASLTASAQLEAGAIVGKPLASSLATSAGLTAELSDSTDLSRPLAATLTSFAQLQAGIIVGKPIDVAITSGATMQADIVVGKPLATSFTAAAALQADLTVDAGLARPLTASLSGQAALIADLLAGKPLAVSMRGSALLVASLPSFQVEIEGSAAARWSYTATATHWARTGRDDWTREATYAAPVSFLCDYKIEAQKSMDAEGEEFTARLIVYTGRADIKRGDYVLIGASSSASPIGVDGAREVRTVTQYADTFDRVADDFMLQTI